MITAEGNWKTMCTEYILLIMLHPPHIFDFDYQTPSLTEELTDIDIEEE